MAQTSAGYLLPAHPSRTANCILLAQTSAGYLLPAQTLREAYSGNCMQISAGNLHAGVSMNFGFFKHWSTDKPFLKDGRR